MVFFKVFAINFFLLRMLIFCGPAHALLLSSQDPIKYPKIYGTAQVMSPKTQPQKDLFEMRQAAAKSQWAKCVDLSHSLFKSAAILAPWLIVQTIVCLKENPKTTVLDKVVRISDSNPDWFLSGPYSSRLRALTAEVYLMRLGQLTQMDRGQAEKLLEKAMARQDWMDPVQRSRLFRIAGELEFVRQRLKSAETYFRKSLTEKESQEVRDRIRSVMALLKDKSRVESKSSESVSVVKEATIQESELSDRMSTALKTGDLVSAVEDGVEIIGGFPGSKSSRWATERVYEVYNNIAQKSSSEYASLKSRVLREMESVDGFRLQGWAAQAFKQGHFEDALTLSTASLKKVGGSPSSTKTLSIAAHSALFVGDDGKARQMFQELLLRHAGSEESYRALFRLGLMDYKRKDYISAAANFERLLVYPDSEKLEVNARYWLWRSHQKIDEAKAKLTAQMLVEKFPLTYYGLRAKAEQSQGVITLPTKDIKISEELFLTPPEEKGWQRMKLLLESGWFEEAQAELREISEPTTAKVRLLLARYWAAAQDYPSAVREISKCWNDDPSLMGQPFFRLSFPKEHEDTISENSKKYGLDAHLVRSVIRQESGFSPIAVSTAGARGLMQIMPATAEELLSELNLKNREIFDPNTNIQLGSKYLQKMLKKFDGNIAFAVAAYNVGPEKLSRWMKARGLAPTNDSDPNYEVWFDEMPWSETSFYVKAILRNLLIYRTLDKSRVQLSNPVWAADAG